MSAKPGQCPKGGVLSDQTCISNLRWKVNEGKEVGGGDQGLEIDDRKHCHLEYLFLKARLF